MRICYDDPRVRSIQIDRAALAEFLRGQGVSEERIKQLVIRIRPRIPKSYLSHECQFETTIGVSRRNSVVVCTWRSPNDAEKLNATLLHELYHFMTKGTYGLDNYAIEYAYRPSEIAARAFAEQHKERIFLRLDPQLVQVQPAPPIDTRPVVPVVPNGAPIGVARSPRRSRVAWAALIALGVVGLLLKPVWRQRVLFSDISSAR